MNAQAIRFLVQLAFAFAGLFAVVFLPSPYGLLCGTTLLVFGLWLGRRLFNRIATLDETKADLRQRVDEGP
jgi:hypothetical protein